MHLLITLLSASTAAAVAAAFEAAPASRKRVRAALGRDVQLHTAAPDITTAAAAAVC